MKDSSDAVSELVRSAVAARFRICRVEGKEHPDCSWQCITGHVHREDLPWAATALIFAIASFSFSEARPRGIPDLDYDERDEWRFGDLLTRLRLEKGSLVFDADYVRGRMIEDHGDGGSARCLRR
jgi:hypothetical protein